MDAVLELAHLVEDAGDSPNKIPSRDRLVEKIVFNISDIVMITALNVDLDYASKGSVLLTAHHFGFWLGLHLLFVVVAKR